MSVRTLVVFASSVVLCALLAPGAVAMRDGFPRARDNAGAGCASGSRSLAGGTSLSVFDDYIEDTPGPDICGENAVTNDNEGTITFGLHIHNRTTFGADERYGVFLDTDNNPATGVEGADYLIRVASDGVELAKWDGTAFVVESALAPAEWAEGYGPVFQVKVGQLGGAQNFGFFFYTTDGVNADFAPDQGAWSYQLTPLELRIRAMTLDRARAGRSFSPRMAVVRSDFDAPLEQGAIACTAKLGARALAGTGRFAKGRVVCTWRLPKNSRRKRVSGTVAVTFQGVEAKRSFATTIR